MCALWPGYLHSGDFPIVFQDSDKSVAVLIDVAGHGYSAFKVGRPAAASCESLIATEDCSPSGLLRTVDTYFRNTQGAAVGVVVVQHGQAVFASVGNVKCLHITIDAHRKLHRTHLTSCDGLVGVRFRTPREERVAVGSGDILLLHTDGVSQRMKDTVLSEVYAGNASSIARAVVERFGRTSDDASCIALRWWSRRKGTTR